MRDADAAPGIAGWCRLNGDPGRSGSRGRGSHGSRPTEPEGGSISVPDVGMQSVVAARWLAALVDLLEHPARILA
jgi:hypothetical protein